MTWQLQHSKWACKLKELAGHRIGCKESGHYLADSITANWNEDNFYL